MNPSLSGPIRARRKSLISLRRDWPLMLLLAAVFAGWVFYAMILPPIQIRHKIAASPWKIDPRDPEISFGLWFARRTLEYWMVCWFFYLGASIGSFINVVASRTPKGQTIVTRGSHCPYCDRALSMIDNSPVFGWLMLRGRCRGCRLPISPRYLYMEILFGLIFLLVAAIELLANGLNLPYREWRIGTGIVWTVFYPKWDLIGALVLHLSLFSVAIMLIATESERLKFPRTPLLVILGIYIAGFVSNRVVARVRWTEPWGERFPSYGNPLTDGSLAAAHAMSSGIGLALGAILGVLSGLLLRHLYWPSPQVTGSPEDITGPEETGERQDFQARQEQGRGAFLWHWSILHALSGALLGWQAIGLTSLVASLIAMILCGWLARNWNDGRIQFRGPVIALGIWTCTLLIHHCGWRWIAMAWYGF
ncbi:MAG: prepilin peptidase [Pirellula sp.]|nr:prepilin peptidase [Pirellula sp.]